jgi:hypothetical protein
MKPRSRHAIASVLALLTLSVLFTMAVSLAGLSNMNQLQSFGPVLSSIASSMASQPNGTPYPHGATVGIAKLIPNVDSYVENC